MGTLSSTGILGTILSVLYNLGDAAKGASKLIGLL
ncbi:porin [Corynebacterium sp. BF-R-2]|uniref:Porin n=1 Tax=Corynebacterium singulare TaxID=161899 RepID=A0ABS9PVQ5_9CORY|nr:MULTISPECIES: porin [Corynebacterium]MCG7276787.1 porin [Corynebacterium singulare]MCQ9676480.1 porin [Corynebacterium sp. BF-R-2]